MGLTSSTVSPPPSLRFAPSHLPMLRTGRTKRTSSSPSRKRWGGGAALLQRRDGGGDRVSKALPITEQPPHPLIPHAFSRSRPAKPTPLPTPSILSPLHRTGGPSAGDLRAVEAMQREGRFRFPRSKPDDGRGKGSSLPHRPASGPGGPRGLLRPFRGSVVANRPARRGLKRLGANSAAYRCYRPGIVRSAKLRRNGIQILTDRARPGAPPLP